MIAPALTIVTLLAPPPAAAPAPAAPATIPELIARIDELNKRRDDGVALDEQRRLVEQALAQAPSDYGVLWRGARMYFWSSDNGALAKGARSDLGKKGWDLGERAIKVKPGGIEGHYYAAICMGSYALGLGVVKALSIGLEGKFKERLSRAEQIDARFDHGGIYVAWGRFYDKLPWPKRDAKKAEENFKKAMQVNGNSLRARSYLAECWLADDRASDAKSLADEVRRAKGAEYDPPEERRAKAIAAWLLPKILDKMK